MPAELFDHEKWEYLEFYRDLGEWDGYGIARLTGMIAMEHLKQAHDLHLEFERLADSVQNATQEEMFRTAAAPLTRAKSCKEVLVKQLLSTVVMFQCSMEACLRLVSERNECVRRAVGREKYFARRWYLALDSVGVPRDEFDNYKKYIYKKYRNPLSHLNKEKDLEGLNFINFRDVYIGVRSGWWTFARLLAGAQLDPMPPERHWALICSGVGLSPSLFPDDGPASTAAG